MRWSLEKWLHLLLFIFFSFIICTILTARSCQLNDWDQLVDTEQVIKCTNPHHAPLQFLPLVSHQYATNVALLYKNADSILTKMMARLNPVSVTQPITPHPSMTITNRNSARHTFNVHAHTAAVLLPQQTMLGFVVYFSLSWTVSSAAAKDQLFAQFW